MKQTVNDFLRGYDFKGDICIVKDGFCIICGTKWYVMTRTASANATLLSHHVSRGQLILEIK